MKNAAPTGKDAVAFIIHRAELRAVVLEGNEVAWSTLSGDYETEFYKGQEPAVNLAAMFFTSLVEGTENEVWENASEDEAWTINGEALAL